MPTPPASPPPSQQQQQQPQHRPTRSAGGVTSPWPTQRVPHAHFDLDRRPEDPLEDSEAAASAPNVGLELEELGPTEGRANGSGGGGGGSGGGGDGLPTPAIDLTLVSPPRPPGSNGSNGHHDKPQAAVPPFSPALVTPVEVELIPGYKRLRAFLMICVTWSATLQVWWSLVL